MKKQTILDRLDQAWIAFKQSYTGLTNEQMQQPGVMGQWSVKDLIAHVSWWRKKR